MPSHGISRGQFFHLIIQTIIGIGVLSLPKDVFRHSGHDGWISVILAGFLIQINMWILWKVVEKYPHSTFYEILIQIWGPILGRILQIVYFLYYLSLVFYLLILFTNILNTWMLPLTPKWVLLLLILGVCVHLAMEPERIIARFDMLISPLLLVMLFFIVYVFFHSSNVKYLLPIGHSGFKAITQGSLDTFFALKGYEIIMFINPFLIKARHQMMKVASYAIWFVTIFYTIITICTLSTFTPEAINLIPEPVIYMMKGVTFKIIERPDLIFLTIWFIIVCTTVVSLLYIANLGLKSIFTQYQMGTRGLLFLCSILLLGFLIPIDERVQKQIDSCLNTTGIILTAGIPFLCLLFDWFRHRLRGKTG